MIILFIFIYLLVLFYHRMSHSSDIKEIILDVRSKTEWDMGHDPHAIHLPHHRIDEYKGDKNGPIKLYCRTGRRATEAKVRLEELGYTNVEVMKT